MIDVRVAVLAAGLAATGCQSLATLKEKAYGTARAMLTTSYDDPQAEAKVARGEELVAAGHHREAEPLFKDVASNTFNPILLAEKARFLEAECLRHQGKYPEAVDTYHRCVVDFPGGAYRERACAEMFKVADYWLDDTRTEFKVRQAGESTWPMKLQRLVDFDRTKPTFDREGRAVQALEYVHTNDITGPPGRRRTRRCSGAGTSTSTGTTSRRPTTTSACWSRCTRTARCGRWRPNWP
jgi:hypothetical protein